MVGHTTPRHRGQKLHMQPGRTLSNWVFSLTLKQTSWKRHHVLKTLQTGQKVTFDKNNHLQNTQTTSIHRTQGNMLLSLFLQPVNLLPQLNSAGCALLTFIRPSSNWKTFGLVALAKTAGNNLVLGSTCGAQQELYCLSSIKRGWTDITFNNTPPLKYPKLATPSCIW